MYSILSIVSSVASLVYISIRIGIVSGTFVLQLKLKIFYLFIYLFIYFLNTLPTDNTAILKCRSQGPGLYRWYRFLIIKSIRKCI